ncbi:hydrolase [Clostridium polyendosporum]|uniref:Hydrolase n=1 Tax=Clostridium polyendosporum TaxID=69208 RepID=A0A919RYF8_9CLOT|nr:hydrolase [Clostridium polyendosporum]
MRIKRYLLFKEIRKQKRVLLYIVTFFIAYIILLSATLTKKYDLTVGDIPKFDIKAPREIVDENATQARQNEEAEKVDKQYTLKTDVQKQAEENIKNFFAKLISLKDSSISENDKVLSLSKLNVKLDNDEYATLLSLSKEQINELSGIVLESIAMVYTNAIEEDKQSDIQNAKIIIDNKMANINYNRTIKEILKNIGYSQIAPNFFFDKEKTDEKIKEAKRSVPPIVIKKNQTIVKEGEPVTENQLKTLDDLGLLNESSFNLIIYINLALYIAIPLFLQFYYINKFYNSIYQDISKLLLISIVNLTSLVLARTLAIISPNLIPLACAPILITLLINYKISLVQSLLNSVLIAVVVNFNPEIIILCIVNTILGVTSLRKIEQRNDILYSTIFLAAFISLLTFGTGMLLSNNIIDILIKTGLSAIGCLFSGVLAVGLLPFFESTFDVVTTVKLLELSNPNNPLLKKLLMEAHGTYHHSMLVANLAEMAAEEIGGNPVLARIGAYYHDVGKTKRPYFFKENQVGKENPHDKITPNLSTLIVLSHVKDGLELAREYNIPKVIQDIIEQHHGTTLVKYFYITAKNNSENPEEIKEEDFRYPGPIPESKEAGIIMLADSVEAAVRSLNEHTKGKIEEMVNNIIKDKLYSGQLDNCDLTLKDINKIRSCFLKTLNGIYHNRIEYPMESKK